MPSPWGGRWHSGLGPHMETMTARGLTWRDGLGLCSMSGLRLQRHRAAPKDSASHGRPSLASNRLTRLRAAQEREAAQARPLTGRALRAGTWYQRASERHLLLHAEEAAGPPSLCQPPGTLAMRFQLPGHPGSGPANARTFSLIDEHSKKRKTGPPAACAAHVSMANTPLSRAHALPTAWKPVNAHLRAAPASPLSSSSHLRSKSLGHTTRHQAGI